jgi:hypothetical protein
LELVWRSHLVISSIYRRRILIHYKKRKRKEKKNELSCRLLVTPFFFPFNWGSYLTVLKVLCLFHFSQGILSVVLLVELFTLDWHWLQAPYGGGYLRLHIKLVECILSFYFSSEFGALVLIWVTHLNNIEVVAMYESSVTNMFEKLFCECRFLNSLNIPLSVETVCVFTAPIFSAFASWATYLLTKVCILTERCVLRIWILSLALMMILNHSHLYRKLRVLVLDWQRRFFWLW